MTRLLASIIASESAFLFFFFCFSIVFLLHRQAINKEYSIKEKYNEIARYSYTNKFKYLQTLSHNNEQLQKVLQSILANKDFFDSQLKIARGKIITLTKINSKYFYHCSKKLSVEIIHDLDKCELMISKLKTISLSATEYSKNVNDLITDYREIAVNILNFYELHLLSNNNIIFKNLISDIYNTIEETKPYIVKINNEELLVLLQKLNTQILNFFNVVVETYILNKTSYYIELLQKQIDEYLKLNINSVSASDLFYIEKNIAVAKNNTEAMKSNLKEINLKQANDSAIISVKILEKIFNKIKEGDQANVFIQKDMVLVRRQVVEFIKEIDGLKNAFKNILSYFNQKDPPTTNKIKKIVSDLQNITYFYQKLNNEFNDYATINKHEFIQEIHQIVRQIIDWKNELNILSSSIYNKYKDVIKINDDLSELKLTLSQMLGAKIRANSNDEKTINATKNIINKVNDLQEQLSLDYFGSITQVKQELSELSEQTVILLESTNFDETLKLYTQKILFFLNKYRNESPQINEAINVAEEKYKQNNFQQAIEILIDVATQISDAAKVNKIQFN